MPVHDWTRVDAGVFHDFHLAWVVEISRGMNNGLLPPTHYSLIGQSGVATGPDRMTADSPGEPEIGTPTGDDLTAYSEADEYALRQRTLVIRHVSNHRIIALIEILSPGNKSSRHAIRSLLDKAAGALAHGMHLLLIDLHPPGPRDPQGIHGAIWEHLTGEAHEHPADHPLTLASYPAGPVPTAYVEPVAVAQVLPQMPLFLTPEHYINVPLESTYQEAYAGVPRFYRAILER